MASTSSAPETAGDASRDAVAAAALTIIRRALVEGVPVTRELVAAEACVSLDVPPRDAMRALDDEAQRLGVSSLG
jgi:hypothetical protein